jgi:hypothetical protein
MTTSRSAAAADVARLADAIVAALREKPLFFMDLVRAHRELPYRTLLLAWGVVRERERLGRDDEGRYLLP